MLLYHEPSLRPLWTTLQAFLLWLNHHKRQMKVLEISVLASVDWERKYVRRHGDMDLVEKILVSFSLERNDHDVTDRLSMQKLSRFDNSSILTRYFLRTPRWYFCLAARCRSNPCWMVEAKSRLDGKWMYRIVEPRIDTMERRCGETDCESSVLGRLSLPSSESGRFRFLLDVSFAVIVVSRLASWRLRFMVSSILVKSPW